MNADAPVGGAPDRARGPNRNPWVIAIGVVVLVALAAAGISAWRWRSDRAFVGTEVAVELTWGMCVNGIGWQDPETGIGWWAGHDIVASGDYESEPRHLVPGPATPTEGVPLRHITRHSTGTMRFDSLDRATFTSRTGGTLQFERTPDDQIFTADCVQRDILGPGEGVAPEHYGVALEGVLGRAPSGPEEPILLAPGVVRVLVDGVVVTETPVTTGEFRLYVPVLGTMTVEGDLGDGPCASDTRTITSGVPAPFDLICGAPPG